MKEKILLALIILLGLCFRFYGIDFDKTCCQHPDERAIVMFTLPLTLPNSFSQFLSPQSPLNPHFFAYGNFPLYLLKLSALTSSFINPIFLEYSYINYVGRFISIIADLISIFAIFKIGSRVFNKETGLASAFIYSISTLPIQYSHFYTSDILLTMLITLILWRCIKFYNKPSFKNSILIGICTGLALATKISALPIIISAATAILIDFIFVFTKKPHRINHWLPHLPLVLKKLITKGLLIAIFTIVTFILAQPYAIIDWSTFVKQNLEQSQMTNNAYIFPYTLQYVGKIPYVYELKNIFLWGLGPIIFSFSAAGLWILISRIKKSTESQKAETFIILSFLLLYFLVVGRFAVGFMRYLLPIYPILAICAGITLKFLFDKIDNFKNKQIKIPLKVLIVTLLLIWPISFMSIYSSPNTRLAATHWVNNNLPAGSTFTHELWDDTIPMHNEKSFSFIDLGMYDQPDDKVKWEILNAKMKNADYLVVASNRLSEPIQNLSDCKKYRICFPISSKFYEDLFADKLKYIKIAEFTSYPTIPILNIAINDQSADESFTVYDHPKILIYKRK